MAKRSKKDQQGRITEKNKSRLHASSTRSSKISKKTPRKEKDATCSSPHEKYDWKDAICPVCMECPHEAVLLLCASHKKGCRPYLCDTSYEYSNCLDRYNEACPKSAGAELYCPLCRGKVTGWTVVKPAREFLNAKKRSCSQDKCSFSGKFEDLINHMKLIHPLAKPREVDPQLEEEWKRMEDEVLRNDLMTTIRETAPGDMVVGDYMIENPTLIPGLNLNDIEFFRSMVNLLILSPGTRSLSRNQIMEILDIHRSLPLAGASNPDGAAPGQDANMLTEQALALARLANSMPQS